MVNPDLHRRAIKIFEALCDLPAADRPDALDERCGDDGELRSLVEAMLSEDDATEDPAGFQIGVGSELLRGSGPSRAVVSDPERVGRYRILSKLGEGGFGVVYRAEQSEPVRREVALKLIKPGMDSKTVVARFEAERQALALMDHPCVAKVFDGGVTEDGRPYFVMELVRGEPITAFCDRAKMRVAERVALFATVCQAVQHAHSKGVIHRDLKPSNILVGYHGDDAVPKVIDFGIAKALHQPLTDASVFTQLGQMIGTPAYMSPEQADMASLDIDTRSDIYSLGVVLYELLTGHQPFELRELYKAALTEVKRIIREIDPPKPSTRVGTTNDPETVAANRQTESRGLSGVLRRDLDWVVMKCLEKDRARRYPSASELAADLGRFLAQEPVSAGPPSAGYKVSKFVRRHRAGVTVTAMLVITIGAGLFGTILGLVRTAAAEAEARREAVRKLDAADFLTRSLIAEVSPFETGPETKVVSLLDAASRRVEADLGDDPMTEAVVRKALGVAYRDLGVDVQALVQLRRAVELFELIGETSEAASLSRLELATVLWRRGDAEEAKAMSESALADLDARLGATDPRVLFARSQLASAIKHAGDAPRSEAIYRDVLAQAATADVEESWRTTVEYNLALAVQAQGRAEEARTIFERVLERQIDLFGARSAVAVRTRSELASCLARLGLLDESEASFERVLPQLEDVFGIDHPRTVEALANRGVVAIARGEPGAGAPRLEEALARLVRGSTWSHPNAGAITTHLARARVALGDTDAAVDAVDNAISGIRAADLDAEPEQSRARALACDAAEIFRDVDPDAAARFDAVCSR